MTKSVPIPCTKEEMDDLLEAASVNDYYYTLFFIAKVTGRRLGELYGTFERITTGSEEYTDKHGNKRVRDIKKKTKNYTGGVKVKDIDFNKKVIVTQILKRRKIVTREAILTDEACRILKRWVTVEKLTAEDYVFRKRSYRQIQQAVIGCAKAAGIKHKVSFHNFRHYLVTELLRQGWSYDKIAKLTGHANSSTIQFYDHIQSADIREQALAALKNI